MILNHSPKFSCAQKLTFLLHKKLPFVLRFLKNYTFFVESKTFEIKDIVDLGPTMSHYKKKGNLNCGCHTYKHLQIL